MQGLCASQHRRQCLKGHAGNVVQRLLRRERYAGSLRVEAHQPCALLLGAEAVLHQPVPDLARGAELGNLFEEVAVGIEEEAEARAEVIDIQAAAARPLDILNTVIDGERQFL